MSAPDIPSEPEGQIVREAFRDRNLDPRDPQSWLTLVRLLVGEAPNQKQGRPKEWTEAQLVKLAFDYNNVKSQHPQWFDTDICRILARKEQYKAEGFSSDTLRRRLWDARLVTLNMCVTAEGCEIEGGREAAMHWVKTGGVFDVFETAPGNFRMIPKGLKLRGKSE
jgi:hypothetical protein